MNAKKVLFSILITGFLVAVGVLRGANLPRTSADTYEEEEVPRQILVDKTIKNPITLEYLNNLDSSAVLFTADNLIDFKVRVKNTGDEELKNIEVKDTLPPYVIFQSGPGSYDSGSRTLTWKIDKLDPDQESTFDIRVKVVPASQLPQGGTVCVINRIDARAETGEYDDDSSQFCIETRILAKVTPKITPDTGIDPQLALQALSCLSLMGAGLKLRRYR